jgi:DNA-directed RNA polymerase specialized sigma24 family protein
MSYDCNHRDIELLNHNPHQLILQYQKLIDNVIYIFIRSGIFKFDESSEVKQEINEELLNRIPKIQLQFQGKSLLRTYLSVIIRNICNEIARKKTRLKQIYLEETTVKETITSGTLETLIFEDEILRLKKAIALYHKQREKLILCLKLRFRMPFNLNDFQSVFTNLSQEDFDSFVHKIKPYKDSTDSALFAAFTDLLNKYENKSNAPDALRKWIALKINELIELLNGSPPTSHYTEETLQILFEKCFFREKENVSMFY